MKNLIFTTFCVLLFLGQRASAQSIFISTTTELHKTFLGTCNTNLIGSFAPVTGMLDIAFNPNGNLYGITANDFYQIDTLSGAATYIGTHNTGVTALTSDNNGNVFAATSSGNFYTINISTGIATFIGVMATGAAGDLAFFDGNLYMADVTGELFRINPLNPASGASIGTMNVGSGVPYGLISTGTTCQLTQFLAGGNGSLFTVNPNTAQTTLLCTIGLTITGLSSPTDYLASDCTLQIDLDYNNSSGALVHDFNADTACISIINVVDNDVFVFSPNSIDSIAVTISSGILDGANEILTLSTAPNLTILGNGTAHLTLVNSGTADYYNYEAALLGLQYQNTMAIPSYGQRQISFHAYSGTSVSTISKTTFFLLSQNNLQLNLGTDTTLCVGNTLLLNATSPAATAYLWNNNTTSNQLAVTQSGTYIATISNYCGTIKDTLIANFNPLPTVNLGTDTTLCNGNILVLNAAHPLATAYLWQNGSTNTTFAVNQTGLYFVEISSNCGTVSDTINVFVYTSNLSLNLGFDTLRCPGTTKLLNATTPFASTYAWNNGSNNPTLTVIQGGAYSVTVTDICNFTVTDTITFTDFVSQITVELGEDTTLCIGETLLFDVSQPTAINYTWRNGSNNPIFTVSSEGLYGVTISDLCGAVSDSINVNYVLPPVVELGNDTVICEGRIVVLDAYNENAATYIWQNGSTNAVFNAQKTGTYSVIISNACATVEDSIKVRIADNTLPLLLHPDVAACDNSEVWIGVDFNDETLSYLWSTGQELPVILVNDYGDYDLTISNGCIERSTTIKVYENENCCKVFVPDAFTPNGDTNNDNFQAYSSCSLLNYEMVIFDRWGTVLFRSTDQNQSWDGSYNGKTLSPSVLVWRITYNDGKFDHSKTGSVTIIQ